MANKLKDIFLAGQKHLGKHNQPLQTAEHTGYQVKCASPSAASENLLKVYIPENTCSPPTNHYQMRSDQENYHLASHYQEEDQENLVQQPTRARRNLFPNVKKTPLQIHSPTSLYDTYIDSPESPPFRIVAVPVELDEETARQLPPLGIVYEYDPIPSWAVTQYQVPIPDDERGSRTRQYQSKPGLATPWERNEERTRRRERQHEFQWGSPVSPDEYVSPLENWFKTPGYVVSELLRAKREAQQDSPNEYYVETSTTETSILIDAENGSQNFTEGQAFTIYADNTSSDNEDYSEAGQNKPDDCDDYRNSPENERSEVSDDELEWENYESNRNRFQTRIEENSEPFEIYCDTSNTEVNGGDSGAFTIYTDSPQTEAETVVSGAHYANPRVNRSQTRIEENSEPFEIYCDTSNTEVNGGNSGTFTIYTDSPQKEAEKVMSRAHHANPRANRVPVVPEAHSPTREKIDKIMDYLTFQDYLERKSFYLHLKKVQEIKRKRIFNTLMGIDSLHKKCVEDQEQLANDEISVSSSYDDTDGSYYCPDYGTPSAFKNSKKKQ